MSKARLLVVEHDVEVRNEVGTLLRAWGYEVEYASDARQALEMVPQCDPQVVIVDAALPPDGSTQLLQILCYRIPDLKFIVMTEPCSARYAREAVRSGVSAAVGRPPDPDPLKAAVGTCLRAWIGEEARAADDARGHSVSRRRLPQKRPTESIAAL